MVIKCPRCSSRYKIDAAGVPDEGTYARCRKCENVFFVRKRTREEVSLLRKSVKKRKDTEPTPFMAHETPRLPDSIIEAAGDSTAEEGQFLARSPAMVMAEERAQSGEYENGGHDIDAMLEAYSSKHPDAGQAPDETSITGDETILAESEPAPMDRPAPAEEINDKEETPLNFSQDTIEALLAAHSPVKRTKMDETSLSALNDIDALLSKNAPKPDETPTVNMIPTPVAAPKQVESASVSQDDIETLLAANAPKPAAPAAAPKQVESASVSQDDIEALLAANAPKPAAPAAAPKQVESASVSQDDIEALLAANAPKPSAPVAAPKQVESASVSQDDIEALLAANAPKPAAPAAAPKQVESASVSQDDIEALLAANAPKPAAPAAAPKQVESASVSQDDIEALLAANAPQSAKAAPATKAAPAPAQKEADSGFDQDSIDSIFAANAPGAKETKAPAAASPLQDDIDALLAASSPSAQYSPQAASGGQSEIDALLASAMTKQPSKPAAEAAAPPKAEGEILSQSDLDALLSQSAPTKKAEEPSGSKGEAGTISQLDIDSILDSAGIAMHGGEKEATAGKAVDDGLLSQDTLDSLLAEAAQEGAGAPGAHMEQVSAEPADDELERLLSGEEDSLGEALFQDGSKAPSSTGEPSLDEMLAGELTPRPPAHADEEDHEHAGAMPGVFAHGDASFTSIEEEMGEEEHAKKKGFNPLAIFVPLIGALKKALGLIPIPKNFIGAIFHKLPPRLAGAMAGLALAVLAGAIGGGWWYLKGEQAPEETQVAQKEAEHKPSAKPEAPSDAHAPAKTPAVAHVAQPAPAPRPSEVFAKAPSPGKYPVSFVVYLPVEFDAETTKILNMNVELIFDSDTVAKLARERLFFSAVTVEKAIDGFFRDKFYEETVFAQDKLEEFLAQNLKTVKQFAGLKDVRLSAFSID